MKTAITPLLLKNAKIYDGFGGEPFFGDIHIGADGVILALEPCGILTLPGVKTMDFSGFAAAPGFIDAHGHSDISLLASPEAFGKLSQGVTTEIAGNCGLSAFPVSPEVAEHLNILYAKYDTPVTWNSLREYAAELEKRRPAINLAALCGHNTLRASITGYSKKNASHADMERMREALSDTLEDGASGFSTGLLYSPGCYSDIHELKMLAKTAARYGAAYATHLRSEGDSIEESLDEAVEIARSGSKKLQISHLKTALRRNWSKLGAILQKIEDARASGVSVTADRYPYTYSMTSLSVILPPPYDKTDDISICRILKSNPGLCNELAGILDSSGRDWTKVVLTSAPELHVKCVGKTVSEVAADFKTTPGAFCVKMLAEDAPGSSAAFAGLSETNMKKILALPFVSCGTDESARPRDFSLGRSHPRGFGSFPEFIKFLRGEGMRMAEIIRKTTSLPASVFGLAGRGGIRPGFFADLVFFDEERFAACSTFASPHEPADGVAAVFVNGELAYCEKNAVSRAGRFLRRG